MPQDVPEREEPPGAEVTGEEAELLAVSRSLARAIVDGAADAIDRLLTEDWVLVDQCGIGERATLLGLVASGELTHDSMDAVPGTERVRVHGDMAVVTARVTNTARYQGEVFHADEWTSEVYLRTADGWRCAHAQVTPAEH